MCATRTAQIQATLAKAHAAVVRASSFTGDEVYGARALRTTLPTGRNPACAKAKALVPARARQQTRTGTGGKGARDYD